MHKKMQAVLIEVLSSPVQPGTISRIQGKVRKKRGHKAAQSCFQEVAVRTAHDRIRQTVPPFETDPVVLVWEERPLESVLVLSRPPRRQQPRLQRSASGQASRE